MGLELYQQPQRQRRAMAEQAGRSVGASPMATRDGILAQSHLQRGNLHTIPSAAEARARGPAGRVSPEVKGKGSGYVHVSERTGPRPSTATVAPPS